ncbi:MAG TPA: MFS transporter [Kofleriaceae bacterium]|nr:MFS transporter [Kofleriaceae bacterium]
MTERDDARANDDGGRKRAALGFVVMMGLVSLFADACYEGMRSAVGPYLAHLGASATAVGIVAGSGELVGYGLRYVTGRIADRTRAYWALTIIGYSTNLIAVPLLAVAQSWEMVAALIVLERLGKAIRNPARSTILSFAASELGHGKSFALHEAMDQLGAVIGPLSVAAVLWWRGDGIGGYQWAFALLAIPAALSVLTVVTARSRVPDPRSLASSSDDDSDRPLGRPFVLYLVGVALVGFGLADWALLAFHLEHRDVLTGALLPVVYAAAMAADGGAALLVGGAFDRARARGGTGLTVLAAALLVAAASLPLVLLGNAATAIAGIALWAVGLGATESIGKATVAILSPRARRGAAYGLYYLVFGTAWWLGSILIGVMSDHSRTLASAFGVVALLAAAATMLAADRAARLA